MSEQPRVGKDFLNNTQKALTVREKMGKIDYIKIQNFSLFKHTKNKMQRNLPTGRRYLDSYKPTKD